MASKEKLELFKDAMYDTLKDEEYYYADLNNDDKNISWNSGWNSGLGFVTGAVGAIIDYNKEENVEELYHKIVDYIDGNKKYIPDHTFDRVSYSMSDYDAGFKAAIEDQKSMLNQTWEQLFSTDEEDETIDEEEE